MAEIVGFDGHVTPVNDADRVAKLLIRVGERVKAARTRAGLSRRALSESSGVSQRYLVQLENGQGNISISLLLQIAAALDAKIEWFVAEDDPWHGEWGTLATLLAAATKQQRDQVLAILDPEHPDKRRGQRIAFIGLRGAGKSTLGRLAADRLALPFLELNTEIEQSCGIAVTEVMALYGQEGYRQLERDALERIVATHDTVLLAVAGGIVSNPESFNYLLRHYHTVWLKAAPEEHMARVRGQGDERPMAGNPDAMNQLRDILKSREQLYARADLSVDTSNRALEESLEDVVHAIQNNGRFIR